MGCCEGYCGKCSSMQTLVLGAAVVANSYWGWFSWSMFVGALIVLYGAMRLIMPSCPCNKGGCCEGGMCSDEKPSKKKK